MTNLNHPAWMEHELAVVRDLFNSGSWPDLLGALPGRTRAAILQKARLLGLKRDGMRRRWTTAEVALLWKLFPAADPCEVEDALHPRTFICISKMANTLGVKRLTLGTRKNNRFVHPLIRCLRAVREKRKLSREGLSKILGYDANMLLGWELGKTNPNMRYFVDWAQALGVEIIMREKITPNNVTIPWPDRKMLMAGR